MFSTCSHLKQSVDYVDRVVIPDVLQQPVDQYEGTRPTDASTEVDNTTFYVNDGLYANRLHEEAKMNLDYTDHYADYIDHYSNASTLKFVLLLTFVLSQMIFFITGQNIKMVDNLIACCARVNEF